MTTRVPRGIRNNNPGNIRISSAKWLGKVKGKDKAFETFSHADFGIRALMRILLVYYNKHGLKTPNQIINRYAPPVENKTHIYADFVADALGIGMDDVIELTDENWLKLLDAIITKENGVQPYPHAQLNRVISHVLHGTPLQSD